MSGIPSWAVRGRDVVCIMDGWSDNWCRLVGVVPPDRVPMLNEVLRISEVHVDPSVIVVGCYLVFDGIPPFLYAVDCFRPLIGIEDDIEAHFSALLQTQQRVGEDA